jgi:hypothetical protein
MKLSGGGSKEGNPRNAYSSTNLLRCLTLVSLEMVLKNGANLRYNVLCSIVNLTN